MSLNFHVLSYSRQNKEDSLMTNQCLSYHNKRSSNHKLIVNNNTHSVIIGTIVNISFHGHCIDTMYTDAQIPRFWKNLIETKKALIKKCLSCYS